MGWLYGFLLVQFACQVALVAPLGSLRIGFRAMTFVSSLALLVLVPAGGRPYSARGLVLAVPLITALGLLHPALNTPAAGLAQVGITLAIWGPAVWATRIRLTPDGFRNLIILLWAFHTISAVVGVLQVYDPDRFSPDPTFIRQQLGAFADGLQITLDDGRKIWRPFGLTDTPGGAASSGAFAALAGLAVATSARGSALRGAAALSAAVGMFCIYICQIRSILVVTALGMLGIVGLMAARGQLARAGGLAAMVVVAVGGGYAWVNLVGGEAASRRLETLAEDQPGNVYYNSRGQMLEATFERDLPSYPLGAGLGRWGMMFSYFGDPQNTASPPLWAEIQPAAWILDGGLLLLIVGYAAVVAACVLAVRITMQSRDDRFSGLAAVVAAFDLGVLANTFSYAVFISQTGMIFWLLNAALFAATPSDRSERTW